MRDKKRIVRSCVIRAPSTDAEAIATSPLGPYPHFHCGRLDVGHFSEIYGLLLGPPPKRGFIADSLRVACKHSTSDQATVVYEFLPSFVEALMAVQDVDATCVRCASAQRAYRPSSERVIDHFSRVIRGLVQHAQAMNEPDRLLVRVRYKYVAHSTPFQPIAPKTRSV
jgi:hypothetical protein